MRPTLVAQLAASLLLALTAAALPTYAQRRDVRLSPPEPVSYALPDTLRMQAADRIGPLTLVAWSSSRRRYDSTFMPCLWGQFVRDTTPIGVPFPLHPDNAWPTRVVTVAAHENRFLVAWRDERSGAGGIYAVLVDRDGALLRPPERIHPVLPDTRFFRAYASAGGEWTLVWTESRGKMRAAMTQSFDADLGALTPIDTLGVAVTWERPLTPAADAVVLTVDSVRLVIVGRSQQRLRRVTARVCTTYTIAGDGQVLTACGDTLRLFRSLFDTAVVAQTLPFEVEGRRLTGLVPVFLGGAVRLIGLTRDQRDRCSSIQRLYRVDLDSNLNPLARLPIGFDSAWCRRFVSGDITDVGFAALTVTSRCGNLIRVDCDYSLTYVDYSGRKSGGRQRAWYVVDASGNAAFGLDTAFASCDRDRLERTSYDTISSVSLGAHIGLSVPTAWWRNNRPQTFPAFVDGFDDNLVCWVRDDVEPYVLLRWPRVDDTLTTTLIGLAPEIIPPVGSTHRLYSSSEWLFRQPGGVALHSLHTRDDGQAPTPRSDEFPVSQTTLRVYRPTSARWGGQLLLRDGGTYRRVLVSARPMSIDPVTGVASGGYQTQTLNTWSQLVLFAINRNGQLLDSSPIDSIVNASATGMAHFERVAQTDFGRIGEYLYCDSADIRRFGRNGTTTLVTFSRVVAGAAFQSLGRGRFLRSWYEQNDRTRLAIELYDIARGLVAATEVRLAGAPGEIALIENRADRSFCVLFGGDGLWLHHLDSLLRPLAEDVHVNEQSSPARNPNAVIRGDTMLVVWEDYRFGGADVFATYLIVSGLPSAAPMTPARGSTLLGAISPQPARGVLHVTLGAPLASAASLALFDMHGERRMHSEIAPGSTRLALSLETLPSGVYLLTLRSGERTEHLRVVVVR